MGPLALCCVLVRLLVGVWWALVCFVHVGLRLGIFGFECSGRFMRVGEGVELVWFGCVGAPLELRAL